jgi:hypothetical protein
MENYPRSSSVWIPRSRFSSKTQSDGIDSLTGKVRAIEDAYREERLCDVRRVAEVHPRETEPEYGASDCRETLHGERRSFAGHVFNRKSVAE